MSSSLVPQVSQSGGIVRKQADGPMPEKGEEPLNPVEDRKELPVVYRKAGTMGRPRARHVVVSKGSTPTGIRGFGEQ